jgi:hypothetical protein
MPGPSMLSPLLNNRLLLHAPCPPSRRCRVPADDRIRGQSRAADSLSCRPLCPRPIDGHFSVARATAWDSLDPNPAEYLPVALCSIPGSAPVPPLLVCRSPTHCPVGQKNSPPGSPQPFTQLYQPLSAASPGEGSPLECPLAATIRIDR